MRKYKHPSDETRHERITRARRFMYDGPSPPLAQKSDDLESLKKSVEDAASVGAALWFSYIFVLFYIAIATGAVTDVELLLEKSVKLPFLNIELPLKGFFVLAPLIFVTVHVYVLTHLVMLGRKAKRFHDQLILQIPGIKPNDPKAATKRDALRGQLPSNIFVQFLAGPREARDGAFGILLLFTAYLTLVVGPLALLLLIQIQFLPYHDIYICWVQRIALIFDLGIIWWLWRDIVKGRGDYRPWFNWTKIGIPIFNCLASLILIIFAFFVATLPDEKSNPGPSWFLSDQFWKFGQDKLLDKDHQKWLSLRQALFEGPVDNITRRPKSLFSNKLVLTGFDIIKELKIEDPQKNKGNSFIFRGRDFQNAVFDLAQLTKVDLTGAILQGASFNNANLQGASLISAKLQGASLEEANLQGVSLEEANLQGASLVRANLQRVKLEGLHLEGASLEEANLQGASLDDANLQGASLDYANLQGASLDDANVQGVSLNSAELQGASLISTKLQGASLRNANLQGASLHRAKLQGASLHEANLQGASFESANLQGAFLNYANLQGASLESAYLQGASFESANLQGAFLNYANLQATNFSGAKVWRTFFPEYGEILVAINLNWLPSIKIDGHEHPWTDKNYNDIRSELKIKINDAESRKKALDLISILDCAKKDQTPCVDKLEKAKKPQAVANFENLKIDSTTYQISLAKILSETICNDPDNGIYVLRGTIDGILRQASPIIFKELQDKNTCPVAAKLTVPDELALKLTELAAIKIELIELLEKQRARIKSINNPNSKQRSDKR